MATPQQENPLFQEGRLILAIKAHKRGQFTSFQSAIITYNIPRTTARRCAAGTTLKRGSIALNRRIIPAEEESLKQ
jgi:hypothetical protein